LLWFFTNAKENRRARRRIWKPAKAKGMTTGHGGRVVGVVFAGENIGGPWGNKSFLFVGFAPDCRRFFGAEQKQTAGHERQRRLKKARLEKS
jgi:hypothetical protein